MNQYIFKVEGVPDVDALKTFIEGLYRKRKWGDLAFTPDEKLPFIVLWSEKESKAILKMTSKAKRNVERIQGINSLLKTKDLKFDGIGLPQKYEMSQCTWWQGGTKSSDCKWDTLEHKGPYFLQIMEPYEPHGAPLLYDSKEITLTPEEERVASFYAKRIISETSGNVAQKWTEDPVFNKNFWGDFKTYLTTENRKLMKSFDKLNFSKIVEKLNQLKNVEVDKADKKVKAAEKRENYGFATINGVREPLGNFTIEPAAIFYGRGENPQRGRIKKDVFPESVTINIGEDSEIPEPPPGHQWGAIVHDHSAAWVATWKDTLSNEPKYVYFSAEGQLKGQSDLAKYDKARKLQQQLQTVRNKYTKDTSSTELKAAQLGSVLYLIDNFGLRVGNEKGEDETDTVGASTLRVEHVSLKPPETIVFDFLGKDSIRYYKELMVTPQIYKNVGKFLEGKSPQDFLFDKISSGDINNYLKEFDKDFSAKVFRTRLASTVMVEELGKLKVTPKSAPEAKKLAFIKANAQVAEVLNHRRTISTKSKESVEKHKVELKELRQEMRELEAAGKSVEKIKNKIRQRKAAITAKEDTLHIAVTTSLTNYIDPRLVVSWVKGMQVPISKIYTSTLQRKFKWAIDTTESDWKYIQPVTAIEYGEKSIVITGDTIKYKDFLKGLGGKYNPNLKIGPGWIFSKSRWEEIVDGVAEEIPELQIIFT